jgi:hypothetical protein
VGASAALAPAFGAKALEVAHELLVLSVHLLQVLLHALPLLALGALLGCLLCEPMGALNADVSRADAAEGLASDEFVMALGAVRVGR